MTHRLCVLPGDGIGPEVVREARRVLEALGRRFELVEAEIGFGAYERRGAPLPAETIAAVRAADATLFGAVTTPPDIPGYASPILELRQRLGLYANVRPCASFPHPTSRPGVDLVIVRENTECLYVRRERLEEGGDRAVSERVVTRAASERIVRYALDLAAARPRRKLTLVHKANVLRETCGLFRRVGLAVAAERPEVEVEEMLVDACAMELIRRPERFDVVVTTNLFGDILSDEASMLVGGLGLAASGNIGDADGRRIGVFEPVHGSAPDIVGTGRANPLAAILSAAMLVEHLGLADDAAWIRAAVRSTLEEGATTPDLGGGLSTAEVGAAVVEALARY